MFPKNIAIKKKNKKIINLDLNVVRVRPESGARAS